MEQAEEASEDEVDRPVAEPVMPGCANCDAPLAGPYCAQCGQQAHGSARSIGAFLRDASHELANSDSRLWCTLVPLLLRPGRLTDEYCADHRARYLPPFRLYLIVSLVFFGISGGELVMAPRPEVGKAEPGAEVTFRDLNCRDAQINAFGSRRLEAALREACLRIAERGPAETSRAIAGNIPRMMFVFLPLMAAVMVPLYWRPKRYYVEHLVFFLHNHSALFLAYTLLVVLRAGGRYLGALESLGSIAGAGLAIYAVWYVWASMRRHYGQGRALTFVKFVVMSLAYITCLAMTLVGAAVVSVLSA
jgi:hypothetical protein